MSSQHPLYVGIYTEMAERIRSGAWAEGMRLPSEEKLREEFETSRGPVRQALALLRSEGLVTGGRGAPPRVRKAVPSQPFDTYISFTDWAATLGRAPTSRLIELTRKLADAELARELDLPEDGPVVAVSRMRGFDGIPVMLERSVYTMAVGRWLLDADLETRSIYQTFREHGVFPTRSRNVIDAVAADPLDARWLEVPQGSPLLRVRRTAFDQDGAIIDITDNRYLPERATFIVENTAASGGLIREAFGSDD